MPPCNVAKEQAMNIKVAYEVWSDTVGAQLGLQWCQYPFPSGAQYGYRFIWRDDQGRLQPDRGQAIIPTAALMFELIQKATAEGWFVTAEEGAGTHRLTRAK
jgi:hypothetical protein